MSIKSMTPTLTEAIKIAIVVTILAISGIGAMIIAKTQGIFGRK